MRFFKLVGFTLTGFFGLWRRMWTCRAKACQDFNVEGLKFIHTQRKTKWGLMVDLQGKHYLLLPTSEYTSL